MSITGNISQICRNIDRSMIEILVNAMVTSRLDYCYSFLCGIQQNLQDKLQRVQNAAARRITHTAKYPHTTLVLRNLHRLPVRQRIVFKLLTVVFKWVHCTAPAYLVTELITIFNPHRRLRSADHIQFTVPRTSTAYGHRALQKTGPILWNSLQFTITNLDNFEHNSLLSTNLERALYKYLIYYIIYNKLLKIRTWLIVDCGVRVTYHNISLLFLYPLLPYHVQPSALLISYMYIDSLFKSHLWMMVLWSQTT